MKLTIELARVPFTILTDSEKIKKIVTPYIVDKAGKYEISVSEKEIDKELQKSDTAIGDYAEFICIYRHIAELLPKENAVVFHCACVKYKGKAYLFTAKSGTGKTTHANLWKEYLGDKLTFINGDKPIISFVGDNPYAFGSCWSGKEGLDTNDSAPLEAIIILNRGENAITQVNGISVCQKILSQTYIPSDKDSAIKTLELVKKLCAVKTYELRCDMTKQAFITSLQGVTGEKYED